MKKVFQNRRACTLSIMLAAIFILAVTSYTRLLQGGDTITRGLYGNSEGLVYNAMVMDADPEFETSYGLVEMFSYVNAYTGELTEEKLEFEDGFCLTDTKLAVKSNDVTVQAYAPGNRLIFYSGDEAVITEREITDGYIIATYDSVKVFSYSGQGSLEYTRIYNNEEQVYLSLADAVGYESQIGLQGMIFTASMRNMAAADRVVIYKIVLAILYAVVLTFICYGLYKKYHLKLAVVFYLVTLLSPWMIGYATNLYWVEFTWFLPMLVGIYCANHITSKKARVISYISVMLAVLLKSLCGYEYISTIMMGAIVFLLTDLTLAIFERKDRQKITLLLRTIFLLGLAALAGFAIALVCHAYLRGGGNVFHGLKSIYQYDVLRRTLGGDPNLFQDVYADSLNASIIRVLVRYLLFDTPLILGISGILFIPLCMFSFGMLVYGVWKKDENKEMLILYIWLGITSVSWFVLGKSHSYIHTGMNFVMWYFGFMQMVFYIVVQAVWNGLKGRKEKRINGKR